MARIRPFNPNVLMSFASGITLNPFQGKCWKHLFLVPLYEVPLASDAPRIDIFNVWDRDALEQSLAEHLGGYTKENRENAPLFVGIGRRGVQLERNIHALYLLYTRRSRRAWKYMTALQRELQSCTGEEQIFLEQSDAYVAPP